MLDVGCSMVDIRYLIIAEHLTFPPLLARRGSACWQAGVRSRGMLTKRASRGGCLILDVGCWILDVGCSMVDIRYLIIAEHLTFPPLLARRGSACWQAGVRSRGMLTQRASRGGCLIFDIGYLMVDVGCLPIVDPTGRRWGCWTLYPEFVEAWI